MCGGPLLERTAKLIRYVCSKMDYSYPVIGVGGALSAESAKYLLDAGASLVQCYSAMVYEGPAFPGRTCRTLSAPARAEEKAQRKALRKAKKEEAPNMEKTPPSETSTEQNVAPEEQPSQE